MSGKTCPYCGHFMHSTVEEGHFLWICAFWIDHVLDSIGTVQKQKDGLLTYWRTMYMDKMMESIFGWS